MLRWQDLLYISEAELAAHDVAAVNLACTTDFPDAPTEADVAECLSRLDQIAAAVPDYQARCQFDFDQHPATYNYSFNIFRAVSMIRVVLKFGVRYHPDKRDDYTPFDTADMFIHGAMIGQGGTCASLPVVYTAVARRLGYPLKIVRTTRHFFCRWDGDDWERFNIEVNDTGMNTPLDSYYKQRRYAAPEWAFRDGHFLRNLTRREEFADFLGLQACRWWDLRSPMRAFQALSAASRLDPENRLHQNAAHCMFLKAFSSEYNGQ